MRSIWPARLAGATILRLLPDAGAVALVMRDQHRLAEARGSPLLAADTKSWTILERALAGGPGTPPRALDPFRREAEIIESATGVSPTV